jgi:hypothetical protein
MIRSPLKLPTEGSPFSASRRRFEVDVTPDRAGDVAAALRDLVSELPDHPALVPLRDAGVLGARPFIVSTAVAGEPLHAALAAYGPADSADALPRLRHIADALDFAAAHGVWHGALTPQDVIVSADETWVEGVGVAQRLERCGCPLPPVRPYAAPEILRGGSSSPASDQYALAAIAYEWLFGRAIGGAAEALVAVPQVAGLDADRLSSAFTIALAERPEQRFEGCTAFITALEQSRSASHLGDLSVAVAATAPTLDDLPMHPAEATHFAADERHAFDRIDDDFESSADSVLQPPPSQEAAATTDRHESPRAHDPTPTEDRRASSGKGLALAAIVVISVAAGAGLWVATRSEPTPATDADAHDAQAFTEATVSPEAAGDAAPAPRVEAADAPPAAPPERREPVSARPPAKPQAAAPDALRAARVDAGLLIHSTPAGASVVIDGVERGVTPVAIRGLALGTRQVVLRREGYRPAQRQITLTSDRPSRTVEVDLLPAARVPASTAARTGELVVDSRPAGATVSVDGRAAGATPLHLRDLAAGTYRVTIQHPGYRAVTTRVDVAPGQRARVAARLEGEQEEE